MGIGTACLLMLCLLMVLLVEFFWVVLLARYGYILTSTWR